MATFVVNETFDLATPISGSQRTLRKAVELANATDGADTIVFRSDISEIDLSIGALNITSDITIVLDDVTLDLTENFDARHFSLDGSEAVLTLEGGTLDNSSGDTGGLNGGIRAFSETTINVKGTTFQNLNVSNRGAAIEATRATVTVDDSYFNNNASAFSGGAIYVENSKTTISDSSFFGNSSESGGAVYTNTSLNDENEVTDIRNSTFAENTGEESGGAIFNVDGQLNILSSTIFDNTASDGGGVWSYGDTATFTNIGSSIIAGNTATGAGVVGTDLGRESSASAPNPFVSDGNNLIGDGTVSAGTAATQPTPFDNGVNGDIVGTTAFPVNPGLAPLTVTDSGVFFDLLANSVARNNGSDDPLIAQDQRGAGFVRTNEGRTDIGAIEFQDPNPTLAATPAELSIGENRIQVINLSTTDLISSEGDGLTYRLVDGDNDNDLFAINADTGAVTFREAQDFEDPDRITAPLLQVLVTDADGFSSDVRDIVVKTVDVNEILDISGIPTIDSPEQGQTSVLDMSGVSISNPEGDDTQVNVFIATSNGVVTALETEDVTVTVEDDGTNISLRGTVADIRDYFGEENILFIADDAVSGVDATRLFVYFDEIERGGPSINLNIDIAASTGAVNVNGDTSGVVSGGLAADTIIAGPDETFVFAGSGADVVALVGDGFASGDAGDDIIGALNGDHILNGGTGADIIIGGLGVDLIDGGMGNDVIRGDVSTFLGEGDELIGGTGNDLLEGGVGADAFIFATGEGNDTIGTLDIDFASPGATTVTGPDFVSGVDVIVLEEFGYAASADALANVNDVNGTAVFSDQGTSITFEGLTTSDLSADDFILV